MNEVVKTCTVHGELTEDKTILNRISSKGRKYLRCRICRNISENNRINKTIYLKTPRKHTKVKLPKFINKKDKSHAYTIFHRFKMKAKEYYEILDKQNNVCAICKKPEVQKKRKSLDPRKLAVDHSHETGKIRGLLCHQCNVGLGAFKDSLENLNAAIEYLKTTS